VSAYATNFISGMQQGRDARYLLAASTAKHLAVYDLEGYEPRTDPKPRPASARCDTPGGCQRWNFDASPPVNDYVNYYLAPFYAAVSKAKVRSIMCSYNAQYGVPSCGYGTLQNSVVREQWGWDGHVVSDYTAIELMQDTAWNCQPPYPPTGCHPSYFNSHDYTHSVPETFNTAFSAGTDVDLGPLFNYWLYPMVANKSVAETAIDAALARFLRTHFMLGLFDDPRTQTYPTYGPEYVDSADGRAAALLAAQESIVLLKNDNNLLPIKGAAGLKIAFIGPHANITQDLLSNYHGQNDLVNSHSPLQVARSRGWSVRYERGCNICDIVPPGYPNMPCPPGKAIDRSGIPAAALAARESDIAVVFVGLDQTSEAENFDRDTLTLPGVQEDLVKAVRAAQPRTVVVFINGGSVSSEWTASNVPAIIEAFYGGELGGDAIIDVLDGTFSPAGKLPVTVYHSNFTARDIRDVDLSSEGGITHLHYNGSVIYPFGWGLSYTSFTYAIADADVHRRLPVTDLVAEHSRLGDDAAVRFAVNVTNTGRVTSDCVVLAFMCPEAKLMRSQPNQILFDFTRILAVAPGESRAFTLALPVTALAMLNAHGQRWVAPQEYAIAIGDVAAPARARLAATGPGAPLPGQEWAKLFA
jgi:beta-glucosidase-like glycosyl hydrolase